MGSAGQQLQGQIESSEDDLSAELLEALAAEDSKEPDTRQIALQSHPPESLEGLPRYAAQA